jgi:DNA-binding MarR family transcriptional regulator
MEEGIEIGEELFEAIELVIFGAIGLTSFALAQASTAELTLHQWRALVVIGRAGTIRVGEVALQIGTAMPATSRLLSRMERRGLVASSRDETDRRATNVTLTPYGDEVRLAVIERRRQLMLQAIRRQGRQLPRDLKRGLDVLGRSFAPYT